VDGAGEAIKGGVKSVEDNGERHKNPLYLLSCVKQCLPSLDDKNHLSRIGMGGHGGMEGILREDQKNQYAPDIARIQAAKGIRRAPERQPYDLNKKRGEIYLEHRCLAEEGRGSGRFRNFTWGSERDPASQGAEGSQP